MLALERKALLLLATARVKRFRLTAAKANKIRAMRAAGVEQSNTERRAEVGAAKLIGDGPLNFAWLWLLYQEVNAGKPSFKSCHA